MNEINPNYFFYFLIICYFILFKIKTLSINLSFPLSTLPCLKWYQKEILCFVLIKNKKEFLPHFYFIHSIYVHWKISSVWKKCYCCWSNNNVCYYSFIYFRVTPRVSLRIGKQFSFVFQSSSLFWYCPWLEGRSTSFVSPMCLRAPFSQLCGVLELSCHVARKMRQWGEGWTLHN